MGKMMPKASANEAVGKSNHKFPPFMRPFLKPNRSDPTLLSSYGDDASMYLKPPYHHFLAMYSGGIPSEAGTPEGAGKQGATKTKASDGTEKPDRSILDEVVA